MSFSTQTKQELARLTNTQPCCRRAEIIGALMSSGIIRLQGGGNLTLTLESEINAMIRRWFVMLRDCFNVTAEVSASRQNRLGGRYRYALTLKNNDARAVLKAAGMNDQSLIAHTQIHSDAISRACCRNAFIRGAFIGCGSISNPRRSYHLEFVLSDETFAGLLASIITRSITEIKSIKRNDFTVLYLKGSEKIKALLAHIGAHGAILEIENIQIVKDMRNQVNRALNCDSANLSKTMAAAERQLHLIEHISATRGLESLPPTLREAAQLRMEHGGATLAELSELARPPVTKSCMNHRLRRLEALGEAIMRQNPSPADNTR